MHHLPIKGNAIPAGPLSDFLSDFLKTKLSMGRVSQVRSLTPNFTVVALKMWATGVKIAIFWYNFAFNQFLQNLAWRRASQVRTLVPNFTALA